MQSPRAFGLYVLLFCMELISGFVLIVGLSLLDASTLGYAAFWVALLVGIAGVATAFAVLARPFGSRWDRRLLLGSALMSVGISVGVTSSDAVSALVNAVLFALAFWRGIAVTREPPGHQEVERRFGFGFALFFVGIVGVVGRGMVNDRWVWQLIAIAGITYVVVALVALGTARIEHQREPGALQAVVLAVAAQIGLLILLGVGALQIFSLDMFGWLGHATQPVSDVVGATLYNLITPFAGAIDHLFSLIRGHAHRTGARVAPYVPQDNSHVKKPKEQLKQHINPVPYAIGGLIVMLILLAVIGYLIWRSMPRRFRADDSRRPYTERRESVLSLPQLWSLILNLMKSWFRHGTDAATTSFAAIRRRVWGEPYPADPVRKAYAQLLRRTTEAGVRRHHASTPNEHQKRLADRWSESSTDIAVLTEAYVSRRYGEQSFGPQEVSRVQASWQRVRHAVRIPKREEIEGDPRTEPTTGPRRTAREVQDASIRDRPF